MQSNQGGDTKKAASTVKDGLAGLVATLILVAFACFIIYLLNNLDLTEAKWARALYLFAGVEAVAFAAAGYFFGTQVQRGKVEEAKKEADSATRVKEAAQETAKSERRAARVLAEGVVASTSSSGGLMGGDAEGISPLVAQAQQILRE